jgi:hypothetical protein
LRLRSRTSVFVRVAELRAFKCNTRILNLTCQVASRVISECVKKEEETAREVARSKSCAKRVKLCLFQGSTSSKSAPKVESVTQNKSVLSEQTASGDLDCVFDLGKTLVLQYERERPVQWLLCN